MKEGTMEAEGEPKPVFEVLGRSADGSRTGIRRGRILGTFETPGMVVGTQRGVLSLLTPSERRGILDSSFLSIPFGDMMLRKDLIASACRSSSQEATVATERADERSRASPADEERGGGGSEEMATAPPSSSSSASAVTCNKGKSVMLSGDAKEFFGLHGCLTLMHFANPFDTESVTGGEKTLKVNTSEGRRPISTSDFCETLTEYRPDFAVCMAEEVAEEGPGGGRPVPSKKARRSVETAPKSFLQVWEHLTKPPPSQSASPPSGEKAKEKEQTEGEEPPAKNETSGNPQHKQKANEAGEGANASSLSAAKHTLHILANIQGGGCPASRKAAVERYVAALRHFPLASSCCRPLLKPSAGRLRAPLRLGFGGFVLGGIESSGKFRCRWNAMRAVMAALELCGRGGGLNGKETAGGKGAKKEDEGVAETLGDLPTFVTMEGRPGELLQAIWAGVDVIDCRLPLLLADQGYAVGFFPLPPAPGASGSPPCRPGASGRPDTATATVREEGGVEVSGQADTEEEAERKRKRPRIEFPLPLSSWTSRKMVKELPLPEADVQSGSRTGTDMALTHALVSTSSSGSSSLSGGGPAAASPSLSAGDTSLVERMLACFPQEDSREDEERLLRIFSSEDPQIEKACNHIPLVSLADSSQASNFEGLSNWSPVVHSRSYLVHLWQCQEMTANSLLFQHNLFALQAFLRGLRAAMEVRRVAQLSLWHLERAASSYGEEKCGGVPVQLPQ
uniref:tRNA-guanine(15) transglycosylase-like domain-containing protein n=1 Tax=Chromera velia CCMP2878 TaxID=1169474 RepID=A0A0G4I6K7_9ALVE|eukprot:Cvel_1897.t1-p1 / transcript=Cvel_1897.t1 / gene=Cvel_1897 / organism=Chromera_velia_CCMP2878 / gene_product=hypothetical protein / transcript_product=hypothetical protein / location=Cvel_scaffold71:21765-29246(-) / protein_length=736 / sequence_SO=supercontig / SO=protein_coding / is_pseudo=false